MQRPYQHLGLLLLVVLVTAANIQDFTVGRTLLEQAAAKHPGLHQVADA